MMLVINSGPFIGPFRTPISEDLGGGAGVKAVKVTPESPNTKLNPEQPTGPKTP